MALRIGNYLLKVSRIDQIPILGVLVHLHMHNANISEKQTAWFDLMKATPSILNNK